MVAECGSIIGSLCETFVIEVDFFILMSNSFPHWPLNLEQSQFFMRCVVGGSRGLQQQKKGSVQLQTVTKVQDLVLYVTHQDENGYWINVLFIGTHVVPNKTFCSQETKAMHAFATKQERARRREGWWFLKVVHCWSRTLIWYQAKMRKAAASCLSTCWQTDSLHSEHFINNNDTTMIVIIIVMIIMAVIIPRTIIQQQQLMLWQTFSFRGVHNKWHNSIAITRSQMSQTWRSS